jgi:hypothetical protein
MALKVMISYTLTGRDGSTDSCWRFGKQEHLCRVGPPSLTDEHDNEVLPAESRHDHPCLPHSPDLTPAYLFVFPKIKASLSGGMLLDAEILKNITAELNAVSLDAFEDCFMRLLKDVEMSKRITSVESKTCFFRIPCESVAVATSLEF